MNLIGPLFAFALSMCWFYGALTYDTRPPKRWGLTRRAKPVSQFSVLMQGLMFFVFSIAIAFESLSPMLRVLLPVVGFAGVFAGMIYDQYIRKEDLGDPRANSVPSGGLTLSVGTTRVLGESVLATALAGTAVGYLLGALSALGILSPGLVVLQVYVFAMAVPWVATMLMLGSAAGRGFALGEAPFWSRAVPCVGFFLGISAVISVPLMGDSLQVGSWSDAASWTRASFFFSVAPMWFIPVPVAMVIRRRALTRC